MPVTQQDPPKITVPFKSLQKDIDALIEYIRNQRVVADGVSVIITDAAGGGKLIQATGVSNIASFNATVVVSGVMSDALIYGVIGQTGG